MQTPHRILYIQTRMSVALASFLLHLADSSPGLHKYSLEVYNACVRSFEALPLTALIDGKFFCVHGGISPELITLRDLENVRTDAFLYIYR